MLNIVVIKGLIFQQLVFNVQMGEFPFIKEEEFKLEKQGDLRYKEQGNLNIL